MAWTIESVREGAVNPAAVWALYAEHRLGRAMRGGREEQTG